MYVIRRRGWQHTLIEMTEAELLAAMRDAEKIPLGSPSRATYERTTSEQARRWVKEGGHHETGLYVVETGKVQYAKADPDG